MDIVAGGFDAGIHFGEFIEKDMIAARVSQDQRPAIVGSPGYFESHPKPRSPRDLIKHRCINFRHGSAGLYRWEFEKGRKSLSIAVNGPLIVDDLELLISAAVDGVGLAYMSEEHGAEQLGSGALVKVLEDCSSPPFVNRYSSHNVRRISIRFKALESARPGKYYLETRFIGGTKRDSESLHRVDWCHARH